MESSGREPARRSVCPEAIEHLEDLPQAVEIQEVNWPGRGINLWWREIIGAAQGDGGMPSVGESDDEIGIDSPTETNDLERAVHGEDDVDG